MHIDNGNFVQTATGSQHGLDVKGRRVECLVEAMGTDSKFQVQRAEKGKPKKKKSGGKEEQEEQEE